MRLKIIISMDCTSVLFMSIYYTRNVYLSSYFLIIYRFYIYFLFSFFFFSFVIRFFTVFPSLFQTGLLHFHGIQAVLIRFHAAAAFVAQRICNTCTWSLYLTCAVCVTDVSYNLYTSQTRRLPMQSNRLALCCMCVTAASYSASPP